MSYEVIYRLPFTDDAGNTKRIDLLQLDYAGSIIEADGVGYSPVFTSLEGQNSQKQRTLWGTELVANLFSKTDFEFLDLLKTASEREFRLELYENSTLKHAGYVIPDSVSEAYEQTPYAVRVGAVSLGALQGIAYKDGSDFYEGRTDVMTVITRCLNKLDFGFDIWDSVNTYEDAMDSASSDSPLTQADVDQDSFIFTEKGRKKALNCYEVLERVLKPFVVNLFQDNGAWKIIPIELRGQSRTVRIFNSSGVLQSTTTHDPEDTTYKWVERGGNLRTLPALREIESVYDHGIIPNLIQEGGLNDFVVPDSNFPFFSIPDGWELSDEADFEESFPNQGCSRIAVDPEDGGPYGLLLQGVGIEDDAYIFVNPSQVAEFQEDDTVRLKIRYAPQVLGAPQEIASIKIRFRIGIYYLQADGSWTTTATDIEILDIGDASTGIFPGVSGFRDFEFISEPIEADGDIEFRIYKPESSESANNTNCAYAFAQADYFPDGFPQTQSKTYVGERSIDSFAEEVDYELNHGDGPTNIHTSAFTVDDSKTESWDRGTLSGGISQVAIRAIAGETQLPYNVITGKQRTSGTFDRYFTDQGTKYIVGYGQYDERKNYMQGNYVEQFESSTTISISEYDEQQTGSSGSSGGSSGEVGNFDDRYLRQSLNGSDIDSASDFRSNLEVVKTISVKNYGAVGTGDETSIFEDALSALPDGGTLVIDSPIAITGGLSTSKNIKIIFQEEITVHGNANFDRLIDFTGDVVILEGVQFDMSRTAQNTGRGEGFRFNGCKIVFIDGIDVTGEGTTHYGSASNPIEIINSTVKITNATFTDSGNVSVRMKRNSNVIIENIVSNGHRKKAVAYVDDGSQTASTGSIIVLSGEFNGASGSDEGFLVDTVDTNIAYCELRNITTSGHDLGSIKIEFCDTINIDTLVSDEEDTTLGVRFAAYKKLTVKNIDTKLRIEGKSSIAEYSEYKNIVSDVTTYTAFSLNFDVSGGIQKFYNINCTGASFSTIRFTDSTDEVFVDGAEIDNSASTTPMVRQSGTEAFDVGVVRIINQTITTGRRANSDNLDLRVIANVGSPRIFRSNTDPETAGTTGAHISSDVIYYASPSAGGRAGALCVSGGSPGTWEEFGFILDGVDTIFPGDIIPETDNASDIGTGSLQWRDLYVGRNAYVAGGLFVKEFVVDQTRVMYNFSMSPEGGKISTVTGSTGSEVITFEDEEGTEFVPVSEGSILRIQERTGLASGAIVKSLWRVVSDVTGNDITLSTSGIDWTTGNDVGSIESGDYAVQRGHTTDADLDGRIDFNVSGVDMPYISIWDGSDDVNGGFEALRVGGMAGFDAGITGDVGIAGATSADGAVFWITEDEAQIGGFNFTDTRLQTSFGTQGLVGIFSDNTALSSPSSWADNASAGVPFIGLYHSHDSSTSTRAMVAIGETLDEGWTNSIGISFVPSKDDPAYFRMDRNISTGALTARIAGSYFDATDLWGGSATKANATVRLDFANGQIFADAVSDVVWSRTELAGFSTNAEASSVTNEEWEETINRNTNGTSTNEDNKIVTVSKKRYGKNNLVFTGVGRQGSSGSGTATVERDVEVRASVSSVSGAETASGSTVISQTSNEEFSFEVDISDIPTNDLMLIEISVWVSVTISNSDAVTYGTQGYLREDVVVMTST